MRCPSVHHVLLALASFALTAACSSVVVDSTEVSDFDAGQALGYRLAPVRDARSEMVARQVERALERELAARGWQRDGGGAEIVISARFCPQGAPRSLAAGDVDGCRRTPWPVHGGAGLAAAIVAIAVIGSCLAAEAIEGRPVAVAAAVAPPPFDCLQIEVTAAHDGRRLWCGRAIAAFERAVRDDDQCALVDRAVARIVGELPAAR